MLIFLGNLDQNLGNRSFPPLCSTSLCPISDLRPLLFIAGADLHRAIITLHPFPAPAPGIIKKM